MCHDADSRPPAPPTVGPVGATEHGTLTAADGNRFAAFTARSGAPNGAGVLILPDVRGLHPYYVALAERFAEAGMDAVAFDYYGRTAGAAERDDTFDYEPHRQQTTYDGVAADAAAALDELRSGGNVRAAFTVGFCFGGSQSWRLAASDLDLAGDIGFYGRPALVEDVVDAVHRPLLMLVAGGDRNIPVADVQALAQRLRDAGNEVEIQVYDGAPHSFFDRAWGDWRDACADSWRRVVDFTARHTPAG